MENEPLAFRNGQFLPASQVAVSLGDAGFVLGATVSEFTRTFGGRLFRYDDHLDRMDDALGIVGIDTGLSRDDWHDIAARLIAHHWPLLDPRDDLGLIQFVTPGPYPTYAAASADSGPTVIAHTVVLPFALWADRMRHGAHLVTPAIRQVPPQCVDPRLKCRSRMHWYLAEQQARRKSADAAALLLDLDGHVTETASGNLLLVHSRRILSPKPEKILPGISRATVAELARELAIEFVEKDLSLDEACAADEAFIASTPYCLMPVTKINQASIGAGRPGPVYHALMAAWSQLVGLDIRAQIESRAEAGRGGSG